MNYAHSNQHIVHQIIPFNFKILPITLIYKYH